MLKDIDIYNFVRIRIDNNGLNARLRQWDWFIWVLVGKADIVKTEKEIDGRCELCSAL